MSRNQSQRVEEAIDYAIRTWNVPPHLFGRKPKSEKKKGAWGIPQEELDAVCGVSPARAPHDIGGLSHAEIIPISDALHVYTRELGGGGVKISATVPELRPEKTLPCSGDANDLGRISARFMTCQHPSWVRHPRILQSIRDTAISDGVLSAAVSIDRLAKCLYVVERKNFDETRFPYVLPLLTHDDHVIFIYRDTLEYLNSCTDSSPIPVVEAATPETVFASAEDCVRDLFSKSGTVVDLLSHHTPLVVHAKLEYARDEAMRRHLISNRTSIIDFTNILRSIRRPFVTPAHEQHMIKLHEDSVCILYVTTADLNTFNYSKSSDKDPHE